MQLFDIRIGMAADDETQIFRVNGCDDDAGAAVAQSPDHANHKFSGAEHWAKVFDDPERDKWQKPHEVITALKLAPDQAVADIGAGTGYFAVRFAHMLLQGRVCYGVDIEPDMVKYLGERAKKKTSPT